MPEEHDDAWPLLDWVPRLLSWFEGSARRLPWRETPSAYRVWVSEIMLQQTQAATVVPYYHRFMERFPDLGALARAPVEDVLRVWEGLGYYGRARKLHLSAGILQGSGRGAFPQDPAGLRSLPGVGPYTAAAIASICFGAPVPVLDGNVLRVLARFLCHEADISRTAGRTPLAGYAQRALQGHPPGTFNQAMMELGALLCTPRRPSCPLCPLGRDCRGRALGKAEVLPFKPGKRPVPHRRILVAVLVREGKVLVSRRPLEGFLGGLWEFPGGPLEPGGDPDRELRGLVRGLTGEAPVACRLLGQVPHAYTHFRATYEVHLCRMEGPTPLKHASLRWVGPSEWAGLPFSSVGRKIIRLLGPLPGALP